MVPFRWFGLQFPSAPGPQPTWSIVRFHGTCSSKHHVGYPCNKTSYCRPGQIKKGLHMVPAKTSDLTLGKPFLWLLPIQLQSMHECCGETRRVTSSKNNSLWAVSCSRKWSFRQLDLKPFKGLKVIISIFYFAQKPVKLLQDW